MKKGFTLIELLAVIVIIAIISVIVVPTIMNVIDKSRINGLKDSAYGIVDAGNLYVAQNQIDQDILFNIKNNVITSNQTNKLLKYKGNIKNGIVVLMTSSKVALCIDDGKNYALKLVNDTEVTTGVGTCDTYEESNGKFIVNSPIDELKKQYEKQLADLKNNYETQVENLKADYKEEIDNLVSNPINNILVKETGYANRNPNAKTVTLNGLTIGKTYIFFVTAGAFGGSNGDTLSDVGMQTITSYVGVDNVSIYKDKILKGTATSTTLKVTFSPKNASGARAWDSWSGIRETNHIVAIEL